MEMLELAIEETTPYMVAYTVYAFVICLIFSSVQYFKQRSQIPFPTIAFWQAVGGLLAVAIFGFTLTGLWFSTSLYLGEKHFVYFCWAFQFGVIILFHLLSMKKTGMQLNSKVVYLTINSILLSFPLAGLSILLTAFEGVDMK